jgi:hypothetical protein
MQGELIDRGLADEVAEEAARSAAR